MSIYTLIDGTSLYKMFDVEPEVLKVIQGALLLEEGRRRSSELVADVESLLIIRLQPPGNIARSLEERKSEYLSQVLGNK